jgi:hypothetical protein
MYVCMYVCPSHRRCFCLQIQPRLQVVAPLTLDLGRFAEFDDQIEGPRDDDVSATLRAGGYSYTLYAIVVHDGGMCVVDCSHSLTLGRTVPTDKLASSSWRVPCAARLQLAVALAQHAYSWR